MADNRPRIVPPWLVLVLAGVVLLTCYAVAPRGGLRERMAAVGAPSDLSAAYLEAWLRVRPHDEELLAMLGAQYVSLGRLADAGRIVRRMDALPSPQPRQTALKLRLAIAQQSTFAMRPDDPRRAAAFDALREQISEAAALDWSAHDLEWLAQCAAAVDAPALALRFYTRLAQQDAAHRDAWDSYVSRYALQSGDYKRAADSWFRRQASATTLDAQRRCFIEGIHVLQAGNLTADAIAVAGRQNDALIDDQPTLVALLDLARAAQRPDLVERYAKALARRAGIGGIADRREDAGRVVAVPVVRAPRSTSQAYAYRDGPVPHNRTHRDGVAPQSRAHLDGPTPLVNATEAHTAFATAKLQRRARIVKVSLQKTGHVMRLAAATQAPKPAQPVQLASSPTAGSPDVADLLYQSFLESADPASAQKVALAQLAKDPHSALWQKRLAQVAEWNGSSQLALKSWLDYARQTNDPVGWRNVLRIAPMLDDDNAYLVALLHAARATPGDLKLVDSVTATYERLGRPDDAIAFLESLPPGRAANALDERTGALAERAGHEDKALAIYRRLQQRDPHNPRYALHTANVLYRDGDYAGALDAMTGPSRYARDGDVEFWRNYGELARLLQRDDAAHDAYRHLLASGEATPDDLGDMAYFYDAYPIDAGRISELRYRRDHTVRALQQAIYYYTGAGAMGRIDALLASLTPEERAAAEALPGFLGVRAEYERQTGRPLDALRDLQRAVDLPGASADLDAALLWTLVDYGTGAELRAALVRWRDTASLSAPLWGPYAAAELRLNRPVDALEYLRRQATLMSRDPLWLLTYADAQEMAGRPDLAWSIRRKVWLQIREDRTLHEQRTSAGQRASVAQATQATQTAQALQRGVRTRASRDAETRLQLRSRRVALAVDYSDPDTAATLLDELLKDDSTRADIASERRTLLGAARGLSPLVSAAPGSAKATEEDLGNDRRLRAAVAQEVAIAWALSHEANPLAKRWLALQAANRLAQPASAQLTVALADNDVGTMERLLAQGSHLPRYDRIDATVAVDRPAQAEALAFEGLGGAPDDTEMHRRLVETALAWPQSLDATVTSYVEHPLDYIEQTIAGSRKIAGHYMVGITGTQDFQRSTDASQLVNVPSVDRSVVVFAKRQTRDSAFTVNAGRREALDSFYTFGLGAEFGRNGPLQFGARAGRNQIADELPTLRIGGMKDNLIVNGNWQASARVTVSGSVETDRFYSQARTYLGSGVLSTAQVSYRIRTAYPDYTIRVVGTHGRYGASDRADSPISSLLPAASHPAFAGNFVPATYTQYGLFAGFGNDLREQYTHRWRPFVDIGIVHDSIQGWGPDLNAGVAGSVFGGDHAALFIEHQRVSRIGTPVTVLCARYSWFY